MDATYEGLALTENPNVVSNEFIKKFLMDYSLVVMCYGEVETRLICFIWFLTGYIHDKKYGSSGVKFMVAFHGQRRNFEYYISNFLMHSLVIILLYLLNFTF